MPLRRFTTRAPVSTCSQRCLATGQRMLCRMLTRAGPGRRFRPLPGGTHGAGRTGTARCAEVAAGAPVGAHRTGRLRGRRLLALTGTGIIAALLLAGVAIWYTCVLPDVSDAEVRVAARLAAHAGRAIAVPVPTTIGAAVVAIEDRRFYQHHGADPRALLRAAWATLHGRREGGSTITEQLAEVLYVPHDGTLLRRFTVLGVALKLERRFTKAQILAMYLNAVYFGAGQWGIAQASRAYFGTDPGALTWGEASLLAGLLQAPSRYDPHRHPAAARRRRQLVLDALVRRGTLTPTEAADAAAESVHSSQ